MAASRPRWRRSSSTRTSSCPRARNTTTRNRGNTVGPLLPTAPRCMKDDAMQIRDEDLLRTLDQKVAPGNAALIVVDVQNDFLAPGGYFDKVGYDLSHARASVLRLRRLLPKARQAGAPVVFIQPLHDPELLPPATHERNRRRTLDVPRCLTGTWGADFYDVRPLP